MKESYFQTIIVGVDFSEYSKLVVRQGLRLAQAHKASLVFVHTVSEAAILNGEIYIDIINDIVKPLSKEIVSFYKLERLCPGSKVVVKLGKPSGGIISVANGYKKPLIVVGHKGLSTALGRFFLGSTAEKLALRSPFPVWIHRGSTVRAPRKVLLPCDFSKRTIASFELAKCIGNSPGLKYEFLHVPRQPLPFLEARQYAETMAEFRRQENENKKKFKKRFPSVRLTSKSGEPAPLITQESKKFDLIAMAPHNRRGMFSSFGSVTAKVVRSGDTPILITH